MVARTLWRQFSSRAQNDVEKAVRGAVITWSLTISTCVCFEEILAKDEDFDLTTTCLDNITNVKLQSSVSSKHPGQ